ncbi:hypothetical protein ACFL3T_02700 [Patescibacteria group bacterium]
MNPPKNNPRQSQDHPGYDSVSDNPPPQNLLQRDPLERPELVSLIDNKGIDAFLTKAIPKIDHSSVETFSILHVKGKKWTQARNNKFVSEFFKLGELKPALVNKIVMRLQKKLGIKRPDGRIGAGTLKRLFFKTAISNIENEDNTILDGIRYADTDNIKKCKKIRDKNKRNRFFLTQVLNQRAATGGDLIEAGNEMRGTWEPSTKAEISSAEKAAKRFMKTQVLVIQAFLAAKIKNKSKRPRIDGYAGTSTLNALLQYQKENKKPRGRFSFYDR